MLSRLSITVELAKEQCMPVKVRRVAEIEMNGVCMTWSVKWGSKNIDWSWWRWQQLRSATTIAAAATTTTATTATTTTTATATTTTTTTTTTATISTTTNTADDDDDNNNNNNNNNNNALKFLFICCLNSLMAYYEITLIRTIAYILKNKNKKKREE